MKKIYEVVKEFKGVDGDYYSYENGELFKTLGDAKAYYFSLDIDENEIKVINEITIDDYDEIEDIERIEIEF